MLTLIEQVSNAGEVWQFRAHLERAQQAKLTLTDCF